MNKHTLYSYRRCPYAMRARMALVTANIQCDVHEISFNDKPVAMLEASPKGTVPVLILDGGRVIDESLDIMNWALEQNDLYSWLTCDNELIEENDGAFKAALDRYKYPNRFINEDCSKAREQGLSFLEKLNTLVDEQGQLCSENITMTDIAIFPFVRQFAHVDKAWFDAQNIGALQNWLLDHVGSALFQTVFKKQLNTPYKLI